MAFTYLSFTWKFSPKTRCTTSASFERSRPLLTKMQVS